jgi:hypothetical protein
MWKRGEASLLAAGPAATRLRAAGRIEDLPGQAENNGSAVVPDTSRTVAGVVVLERSERPFCLTLRASGRGP